MSSWLQGARSAEEVIKHVSSGDRVFIHAAAATPTELVVALSQRADLTDVRAYHLHLIGDVPFLDPDSAASDRIHSLSLFTGPNARKAVESGKADFIPVFLSDIPGLFRSGNVPLDVAIVQLSPPDRHGQCTLGTSCDAAREAVDSARIVLALINPRMPRTHGATVVPMSRITAYMTVDRPIHLHAMPEIGDIESRIGELVAGLIPDGACLQMGIGAIPDAALARLGQKNDLAIHTEMFSDGIIPLARNGNITNADKKVHPGRSVTSFAMGTQALYDFIDDNALVEFHPCDRTNDTALIGKNDRVHAINSALEVDLTGQVCADSMGHRIFSGIGGQMDFVRGAARSKGGKAIIALPSTAARGTVSRITHELKPGAGVVTTRGHVHWVVTEFGAVNLHGASLRERAERLISIAHPDFRGDLRGQVNGIRRFVL